MNRLLTGALLLCTFSLFSQPLNDLCNNAIDLTANLDNAGACITVSEDNTDATPWEISPGIFASPGCAVGGVIDSLVFFSFVAQGVSVDIDVTSIGLDNPHISLHTMATPCDFNTQAEIACVQGNSISLDNQLVVGTTYYIMVGFDNQAEGPYDICVYNPTNQTNDACVNAIPIVNLDDDACEVGLDNYYPSTELPFFPACWGDTYAEVWFSFVAQGVSIADLHVENFTNTSNAYIAVLEGDCADQGNMVIWHCGTNGAAISSDNTLTIGNTYYVVVAFENYESGTFDLCLDNPMPAFNDECIDAPIVPALELSDPDNCMTVINTDDVNNDYPSTDLYLFGCWNAGDSYNVWYQFVAQGPDIDVSVTTSFATSPATQMALIDFGANPCDVASGGTIDCQYDDTLSVDNVLEIGNTYFLALGFENNDFGDYCINFFNPVPPHNDTMCNALPLDTDGACNTPLTACPPNAECFTTEYANPEIAANSFPPDCQGAVENTVWYTLTMQDPANVGFYIDFEQITMSGDVSIALFTNIDEVCDNVPSFELLYFYCGAAPGVDDTVEFAPILDESLTYYLMVGSSEEGEGSFSICVDEIEPCFENNFCEDLTGGTNNAEDIGVISTFNPDAGCIGGNTDEFTCVDGCNLYADPEPGLTGCLGDLDPVVWYQFTTDAEAALLNMTITSDDFAAPSVQLWSTIDGTCGTAAPQGLTDGNLACMVGSQGVLISNSTPVNVNTTYFLAISGVNTFGGNFELCIATVTSSAGCVAASSLTVNTRSFGGPLEGPFFPGEVVNICINVDAYTASGANNCQWFQGIVPVFGAGWDPSSFDGAGQPIGATLNGNAFPANNLYNGGQWDWWTTASYHHPHCYYNIGDFDGNGTLDMCNSLYDPDCVGPGLAGSSGNGFCWYDQDPGPTLPGGWFTSGVQGNCPSIGYPGVDYGDGNTCSGTMGPWNFCFDLTIRTDCNEDENASDLTVGFISFADGEVGTWNGGPSICGLDEPFFEQLPLCCNDIATIDEDLDPICSGGVFAYTLDGTPIDENVDFWEWTVDGGGTVTGGTDGSGPNGTVVIDNLINTSGSEGLVTYNFLGFAGGECPAIILTVNITVYPQIAVTIPPILMCSTPTNPYEIIPDITGGSGTFDYSWNDPDGTTTPNIFVSNPVNGTQLTLMVTDDVGCAGSATITLTVYTTFNVDITPSSTAQCVQDGEIDLDASASGGTNIFDSFDWTTPGNGTASGTPISVDMSGQYLVEVTDDQGCIGKDSINLNFFPAPSAELFVEDPFVCPGVATQIFSTLEPNLGQSPFNYEWTTPDANSPTTSFVAAQVPGEYCLVVTDANDCSTSTCITVQEAAVPEVDLPDVQVCLGESFPELSLSGQGPYTQIIWIEGNGQQTIGSESLQLTGPDTLTVTVTNDEGCSATAEIEVTVFPMATANFLPDTITYCVGQGVDIDAGPGWANYDWQHVPGAVNDQSVFVSTDALYVVELTNDDGCLVEDEVRVIEATFLTPVDTGKLELCLGESTTLGVNQDYFSYSWLDADGNEMSTDETFTTDTAGTFTINVVDLVGCPGMANITVTIEDPAVTISGPISICENSTADLSATAGFASYLWSTAEQSQNIQITAGNEYSVIATTALGCMAFDTITIVEEGLQPTITGVNEICATGNGSITILDAGNDNYVSYEWNTVLTAPGDTLQMLAVNTGGWYSVTVVNTQGCIGIDSFFVTENANPTTIVGGDQTLCVGGTAIISADPGFDHYVWDTGTAGDTLQMLAVNTGGTYTVMVTDANGCTSTGSIVVDPPYQETMDIAEPLAYCVGSSTTLDAGAGYVSYEWFALPSGTSLGTGQTLSVNLPGSYSVHVVDPSNCTASDTVVVDPPYQETMDIAGSLAYCVGSSTTLDAGAGYLSYEWFALPAGTSLGTGQTLIVNSPGSYSVQVVNPSNCTASDTVQVVEDTQLDITIQGDTALCQGGNLVLNAGAGFAGYTWSLDNGALSDVTPTLTITTGGIYAVTVTDSGGCTGTDEIQIDENIEPTATVTISASACNTSADGSVIDFDALITAGDMSGDWTETSSTPSGVNLSNTAAVEFDIIPIVNPGVYQFQYMTNSAVWPCVDQTYVVNVTILDCDCENVQVNPPADICNTDGMLDLNTLLQPTTVTGGTWSINSTPTGNMPISLVGTMVDATNADPGIYMLEYQVTGLPNGCLDSSLTQLIVMAPPVAGFAPFPAEICVLTDTVIQLLSLLEGAEIGGAWSETSTNMSVGGAFNSATATFYVRDQVSGKYTFEYRVDNGAPCPSRFSTVEVVIEDEPVANAGEGREIDCVTDAVMIDGSQSSSGDEFDYIWTDTSGTVLNSNNEKIAMVSAPGIYTLTVINRITGCENIDQVEVTANGNFPTDIEFNLIAPLCAGEGSASITIDNVVGGTAPFTYTLNDGPEMTGPVISDIAPGIYDLQVVDEVGCRYNIPGIEIPVPNTLSILIEGEPLIVQGDSLELKYIFTSNSATPDSVVWKFEDEVICLNCTNLVWYPTTLAGLVSVEAYDENGCFTRSEFQFVVRVPVNMHIPNVITPNGDNINDLFTIFINQPGAKIEYLEIFTRWGEKIFLKENFDASIPAEGWDGTIGGNGGEKLLPGVYVFNAKLNYPGALFPEVLKGDITLLR